MYQKWDITFCLHLRHFFRLFFAFLSSTWSWLCPRFIPKIDRWHRAFYPSVGGGTTIIMILVFIHLYDISSPSMAYFRVFQCAKMAQNPMVGSAKKGIESTHSMTLHRVVRWRRPPPKVQITLKKWASLVQIMPLLWASFCCPDHTFPWVLLGFLHIFPNKKPLSSGFLKSYLIAFSDSHFGITGFTSFGHSLSMTTSSDDVGRSATK